VFEAGRRFDLLKKLPGLFKKSQILREGMKYHSYLKKVGIPFHYGWGILEAMGDAELRKVTLARFDKNWKPVHDETLTIATDCLGVGYGFVSRVQLTQLMGCRHEFDAQAGGARPIRTDWLETSQPGIYAAGDSSGVYGSEVAAEEGKLAALGCLLKLGRITESEANIEASSIRRNIRGLVRFQESFRDFSSLRKGLLTLPKADTVICRCENVSRAQIDRAIETGVKSLTALKMSTRVGMGDCQGKMCGSFCRQYLADRTKQSEEQVGELLPRFPLAPVTFGAFSTSEKKGASKQ
jgi:hydrogen cyanide synthase HcnB